MPRHSPGPRLGALTRRVALLVIALVALVSCYTAPITERRQFILIGRDAEIGLGVEAYRQALEGATISKDAALQARIRRIGMRIAEASGQTDFEWEFNVIEDDEMVNAWALPGGKVAVYTGIIKLAGDDDALLATVMGHEIAHATHRHGAERMTQQLGVNVVAAGLGVALEDRDPATVGLVMGAFGVGANLALVLPFGREQESEADRVGLIYMARAGYHPAKAIEFWQKMAALGGSGGPPEFLSTHPSYETRLENLQAWHDEALAELRMAR